MHNKHNKNRKLLLGAVALVFALGAFVFKIKNLYADTSMSIPSQIPDLQEQISTDVSPATPKPGDSVTITLSAYGTDLNATNISWSINGSTVSEGQGKKSLTFTAGKAGQASTVVAKIILQSVGTITKTFSILPQTVDLIWEAHTYTPPFYKGKALYSPQENVVFVAMPNLTNASGSIIDPSAVTYTWRQNTQVVGDRSGYGVNAFAYQGGILASPVIIDVDATGGSNLEANNFISLAPTSPVVGLYEDSPLYGMLFNTELSNGFNFGATAERTIASYPYYFGITNKSDPVLAYDWTINGTDINVPSTQNETTLRNTAGQSGHSIIGSYVSNPPNILEYASTQTDVNFAKPQQAFAF